MTRIEFLAELSRKLNKLPKEELANVLSYYDEVFFDAGVEHEAQTAEKLGNIDDIARQILIDNNIAPDGDPEYFVQRNNKTTADNNNEYKNENPDGNVNVQTPINNSQGSKRGSGILVKLLILVVTFPIWLPVLIAVVSVLFALIVAAAAIVFALAVSGVACVFGGIVGLFFEPIGGVITIGIGLVLCGLMGILGVPIFRGIFRWLRDLLNSICTSVHNLIEKRRTA